MSVFDRVNKCAVEEDAVKKSQIPRLRSRRITINDAFSNGQLPLILKKSYQCGMNMPGIYSLVLIAPDNTYYEIETELANRLRTDTRHHLASDCPAAGGGEALNQRFPPCAVLLPGVSIYKQSRILDSSEPLKEMQASENIIPDKCFEEDKCSE